MKNLLFLIALHFIRMHFFEQSPILSYQHAQIHCYQQSQFYPYLQGQIHPYLIAPTEARLSTFWVVPQISDQLLPAKQVAPLPENTHPPLPACSKRSYIIEDVRASMSEWWDQL